MRHRVSPQVGLVGISPVLLAFVGSEAGEKLPVLFPQDRDGNGTKGTYLRYVS